MRDIMPAYAALPTGDTGAPYVYPVIAAIPLDDDEGAYAITAISASLTGPASFIAAEVTRRSDDHWYANETFPRDNLADALADMASLAGRAYPRFL